MWTSDACPGGYYTTKGKGQGVPVCRVLDDSRTGGRCCADHVYSSTCFITCSATSVPSDDGSNGNFYCINGGTIGGTTGSCTCTSCNNGYSGTSCETSDGRRNLNERKSVSKKYGMRVQKDEMKTEEEIQPINRLLAVQAN